MFSLVLVDFSESLLGDWRIQNDDVMGGVSSSQFKFNSMNYGEFSGKISLKNNGGFCGVFYAFEALNIEGFKTARLRIKGDKKKYKFRIRRHSDENVAYKFDFVTSGNWEEIKIPLHDMYAMWRGKRLDIDPYPVKQLSEVGFLISNGKAENFSLEIDKIWLE